VQACFVSGACIATLRRGKRQYGDGFMTTRYAVAMLIQPLFSP
jgi:hypothetical protein